MFGFVIVLIGAAHGFRKVKLGMPLAGSCSAAISAACHAPEADVNASLKRLKWGVVAQEGSDSSYKDVGHCCFTSLDVEAPVAGKWYAG